MEDACPTTITRRRLLELGGRGAAVTAFRSGRLLAAQRIPENPFTLGIASGDPLPHGVVLWTRLAPDPVAADGRGGMPETSVPVEWQVSNDESFRRVVRRGTELARPRLAHSVHAEVDGLEAGRDYY